MDRDIRDQEQDLIELGQASVETRGAATTLIEIVGHQPNMGCFED